MWIFSEVGFFSTVASRTDRRDLVVRSRFREDLDRLRERYLPSLGPTLAHRGTDYEYRAIVRKTEFAAALDAMARDINYQNFKDRVWQESGRARHDLYLEIWAVLRRASLKRNPRGPQHR